MRLVERTVSLTKRLFSVLYSWQARNLVWHSKNLLSFFKGLCKKANWWGGDGREQKVRGAFEMVVLNEKFGLWRIKAWEKLYAIVVVMNLEILKGSGNANSLCNFIFLCTQMLLFLARAWSAQETTACLSSVASSSSDRRMNSMCRALRCISLCVLSLNAWWQGVWLSLSTATSSTHRRQPGPST